MGYNILALYWPIWFRLTILLSDVKTVLDRSLLPLVCTASQKYRLWGGGGRGDNLAYNVFFPRYAVIIFFEGVITQLRYFNRSVPIIASPQTSFGVRLSRTSAGRLCQ